MAERELIERFVAEMQSFARALHQRLERITAATSPADRAATARELRGLADTMSTLCSSFRVTDCAGLAEALAAALDRVGDAPLPDTVAEVSARILAFIERRIRLMAAQQRVLPPTEEDEAAAANLEAALLRACPQERGVDDTISGSPTRAEAQGEAASQDMLELVRRFQTSPLKRRETPARHTPLLQQLDDAESAQANHPGDDEQVPTAATAATAAAPGQPRHVTAEELDVIPDELKRLFVTETTDDLDDLHHALLRLEQNPDDVTTVADMGRVAHKVKGAAATFGFDELASLMQIYEDLIKGLHSRRIMVGPESLGHLFRCLGLLQAALAAADAQQPTDPSLIEQARALHDELLHEAPPAADSTPSRTWASSFTGAEIPSMPKVSRPGESESLLRVDLTRLDALMSQVSALTMNRATLAQAREEVVGLQSDMELVLERLTHLSRQLTDLHPLVRQRVEHEAQQRFGTAPYPGFGSVVAPAAGNGHGENGSSSRWDELQLDRYTEFDDSLRALSEAVADMTSVSGSLRLFLYRLAQSSESQENIAQQIQQDVMQIRLVPLKSLVPRLQFPARRLAEDLGKLVNLTVLGEMTEIDRDVSEALAEPLSQLVRNAIVHGIESPEERRDAGKPEAGSVWLHAHYDGNEVSIEIGDDGRGINPDLLIASARVAGVLDPAEAAAITTEQALDLMFVQGISTLGQVGVTGGRGVGMDEVRTEIERLKGTITVRSEQGQGSVFNIRVPISLSIVRALAVRAHGQGFALPSSYVLRTLSIMPGDIIGAAPGTNRTNGPPWRVRVAEAAGSAPESDASVESRLEEIPLLSLSELLGHAPGATAARLAVLLEVGQRRIALEVDDFMEERDIVVRALPRHLRRKAIRGASVTSDGTLLLLVDVPELVAPAFGKAAPRPVGMPSPSAETPAPAVLIVDDSVSIRRTLELILSRAGYEVQTARDGVEALNMMLASPPRVLILDIEMPQLDGFELLSVLRGSEQFAGVRVVMLTSRGGERHREYALSLGADDYLIKPCPQELLLDTVQRLIMEAPVKA
jgi:chemotaxis protein histidine kinase CheA/ActR/RegA family two-component response regulator